MTDCPTGHNFRNPIRVLIVEDQSTVQQLLIHILSSDPHIRVVAVAKNGEEAIEAVSENRPDVITMDIHMPKLGGIEATRAIMSTHPTPIVIVSGSLNTEERDVAFDAIQAGAISVMERPKGIGHSQFEKTAAELIQTVKLISEIKVVRRWGADWMNSAKSPSPAINGHPRDIKIVAIGASTGGPPVLKTILSALPSDFPVPILVVQHMLGGFVEGFCEWLSKTCQLDVHIAKNGERLRPGHVYLAPDGYHLGVDSTGFICLKQNPQKEGICPSVSFLFRSVSAIFRQNSVGILLTGMGKDGAEELKEMKEKGAVTIVQNQDTSAVFGMPGEAIKLGAANYVLPPDGIAEILKYCVNQTKKSKMI